MNRLLFALIINVFTAFFCRSQSNWEFNLLGTWHDPALPVASPGNLDLLYSGCWGLAVKGREYAVLGGARHVLFFDVTDAGNPSLVGKFEGQTNTVWREFKSYKDRVYAVSDGTSEGLMIFDLSNAQDTIVRTYWSNALFERAHTITLDTTSGRIYLNGGSATQGIIVLDVSQNPDQPQFITHATFQGGLLHDSYVRNDTIYASSGFQGFLVYDMTNPHNPKLLAEINTGGYNHNSWLNTEGTYAYYTEEIPDGRPIRIIDLQLLSMNDLEIAGSFLDKFSVDSFKVTAQGDTIFTSAIPHNIYIRDNILFNSQYEDGLLAYDISNPTQPVLLARYDTHPQNVTYNQYRGNWGNYPWLPSGNIIAGDMQNGLFMLKLSNNTIKTQSPKTEIAVQITPNPAHDWLYIRLQTAPGTSWTWRFVSIAGQVVAQGTAEQVTETTIQVGEIPRGLYFLEIRDETGKAAIRKVILD